MRVRKPDGQAIETPPSSAQDMAPEVLRAAPAYSDYRERHVSVVNLQVGEFSISHRYSYHHAAGAAGVLVRTFVLERCGNSPTEA